MRTHSMRTGWLVMVALLLAVPVSADEFDDFSRDETVAFTQYQDERDAEFVHFLTAQWAEFEGAKGFVRDRVLKPRSLPVAPVPSPEVAPVAPVAVQPITAVGEIRLPRVPDTLVAEPVDGGGEPIVDDPFLAGEGDDDSFFRREGTVGDAVSPQPPALEAVPSGVSVLFFGETIELKGSFLFSDMAVTAPLHPAIASYWDAMSRQLDVEAFLLQAGAVRKRLGLNDWGYHNFLFTSGMAIYGGDRNLANLFTWFISVKSGFDARVGYSDDRVYLLLPSRNRLYGISYLTLQGTRYYAMTFDGTKESLGRVYTYKGRYPRADRLMDYRILKVPALQSDILEKELAFDFKGAPQSLTVSYNKVLVDYYRYYPQTNMKIYFDAAASQEFNYSMVQGLKIKLEGKSEKEAVDYLLGLSQKSFAYKTDDAQLGREKYMFPEETLWYPYSDCEDRSFLFAYLVRRVLKLDVVGLNYPGHVATAVRFSDNIPGDYVVMNNRKYIVCDPTYINASAGMAMPKYKRGHPNVVKIRNWQ